MKTKEEIEQLAKKEIERYRQSASSIDKPREIQRFNGFIKGYTQCQEDMKKDVEYWQGEFDHWHQQAMEMADKKYTEEDMKKCWDACLDFNKPSGLDSGINYKDFINSLNKQD